MSELADVKPGKGTEWKVRVASSASFVATLAIGAILESRGPEFIETLPEPTRVFAGALLVAAASWLAGRAAKTRPESLSQSTIDAVRAQLQRRH